MMKSVTKTGKQNYVNMRLSESIGNAKKMWQTIDGLLGGMKSNQATSLLHKDISNNIEKADSKIFIFAVILLSWLKIYDIPLIHFIITFQKLSSIYIILSQKALLR